MTRAMSKTIFTPDQIQKKMVTDNPWWTTRKIFDDFAELTPRMFLRPFMDLLTNLPKARSIILLGARRVGKTVMLFHSVRELVAAGVSERHILYMSVDTPLYGGLTLEEMLQHALEAAKTTYSPTGEEFYVFFDEIQYMRDWEVQLKVLCDTYRNIRFVASGSAAASLKMKSMESGAGRFTHFELPAVLFCEYLAMTGADNLVVRTNVDWFGERATGYDCVDISRLNSCFADYINYGGYPEVIASRQLRNGLGRYIKEDIVDKMLLRDLPGLYGISDMRELYRLFIHIVYRSGEEFSYEDLSKESGIKKETLRRYITYLESAFLIRILHKIDENARRFQRVTTFKIYVTNPSVYAAVFGVPSDSDLTFTHLVETTLYIQNVGMTGDELFYANWKSGRKSGEVDLVRIGKFTQKPERILEIKWSDKYYEKPALLKSLLTFMETNSLNRAVVTTRSAAGRKEMNGMTLQYVPSALFAYYSGMKYFDSVLRTAETE